MTPSPPPVGMTDLVGPSAERHEQIVGDLRRSFRSFGYEPVIPPVIERADHFLDRSGEEIRSRLYVFTDPGGNEICLRPELTIPTVRLYADRVGDDSQTDHRLRGYYIGPVFRYETRDEGRYRQFHQAGAELIGEPHRDGGDAETLAMALRSLMACGLDDLAVRVSDIAFFTSVLDPSVLSEKWIARLRTLATDPRKLEAFLADHRNGDGNGSTTPDFLRSLSAIDRSARREIVSGLIRSMHGSEHFGSRSIGDIVDRTLDLADDSADARLPTELVDLLDEIVAIDQPLPDGLASLRELARSCGNEELAAVTDRWRGKVEHFAAHGLDVDTIRLDLRVGQGIDYYSNFVFEITTGRAGDGQLCAGGRYDDLVDHLGGGASVPGVGFAISVEQVLVTLEQRLGAGSSEPVSPPDVYVVAGEGAADVEVVRAAVLARRRGLRAVQLTDQRADRATGSALAAGVRFLAVVDGGTMTQQAAGTVTLRDLETREERSMSVDQALEVVSGENGSSR